MTPPLRIGMLAPISHKVPPAGYGPWERVVADLVEELVALGATVTLYAAAGSHTSAELVETVPYPMADPPPRPPPPEGLLDSGPDARVWEQLHIGAVAEDAAAGRFDVIHSHLHVHALPFSPLIPCPMVTTLHGSAWNVAHHPALLAHAGRPFVSLSDAERRFLPELNYVATVHNGIRSADYPAGAGGSRLLFAGRLAPEKAPDLAIEAARAAGVPLVLAGTVEDRHRGYFEERVAPSLADGSAEYVGSLSRTDLAELYRTSLGLLMPLRWDEPFGLVVAEALTSGTPVVAWRRGAMPELVDDGVTGFVVEDVAGAAAAIGRLGSIDRAVCRRTAIRRFDAGVMAAGYADVYRGLVEV